MDLAAEIHRIEDAASSRPVSVRAILKQAGLANSNWARWKNGKTSPSVKTWGRVTAAANVLLNAPEISAPENIAGRAAPSSPHPIPDIAGSPPSDADRTASDVEVARDISSSSSDPSAAPASVKVFRSL